MTIIFDGKAFASEKELLLKSRVDDLKKKGKSLKLISILVGADPASKLYVGLKKKAAGRVGINLEIKNLNNKQEILDEIKKLNEDESVQGIMIQMPLPNNFSEKDRQELVDQIDSKKDIDGLRVDSPFLHPTSKAVIQILDFAKEQTGVNLKTICIVGATGMVGTSLAKKLKRLGYEVIECNSKTVDLRANTLKGDAIISVTGKPGIIKEDMVRSDSIVIDIGSPKGDVEEMVRLKVSFITPVPGGVGPVTITCLLENLTLAV